MYKPTNEAKEKPRVTKHNGKLIAIGGDVVRAASPPKKGRVIKEATSKQYEQLFKRGFSKLIEYVEPPKSDTETSA